MTWRPGIPPKSGHYRVKWDPDDSHDGDEVFITVFENGTWLFPGVVPCAVVSSDERLEDPDVYPGEDTPHAVWWDDSPLVGSPTPAEPIFGTLVGGER